MSTKKFLDVSAAFSCTLGSIPVDGYLWQVGWLDQGASVLLNHCEGRLGT